MTSPAYRENFALIEWKPFPKRKRVDIAPARSSLPAPMIIGDTMDPVQSQVTGRFYTSKSALRAEYRRHGVVEVGNDPARFRKKERRRSSMNEIKDTVDRALARHARGERVK